MDFLIDLYYWIVGPRYANGGVGLVLTSVLLVAVAVSFVFEKIKEWVK